MTWPGSDTRSNSHSVAARGSGTKFPLAAVRAQEDETILQVGFPKPSSLSVRPPGSAGTDQAPVNGEGGSARAAPCSGGLEDGSLHRNTSCRILPKRDQQLAR